ncbi:ABC transporter ATP-binding protein/permease [Gordonia sp. X0973]|uniref:ABC transporter ATP-binding protein/permease n=1 Tax=Gordonia sp. X0973 TaxID=2742602 RepID=UPI002657579B|nr:ATP-binding cassette domain-containing protein [Gordonia sp. X0973]
MGAKDHTATATAIRNITSSVIRIDFHSDTLLYADGELPSAWIRAWFPDPDGRTKLHQRGYTFLDPDPASGTFAICFLVHEPAGPASHWAARAQVGDELVMHRLGGDGWDISGDQPAGYLLVGDVASWPGIVTIIKAADPAVPVRVYLEYTHDDDRDLPLPDHPKLTVTWVPGTDDARALVDALGTESFRGWKSFVAAETTATRLVRSRLQLEDGHNKATMHAQAYWIRGRAMGKQVDAAEVDLTGVDDEGTEETAAAVAAPVRETQTEALKASRERAREQSILRPAKPAFILSGVIALVLAALAVLPLVLFAEVARRFVEGATRDELVRIGVVGAIILVAGATLTALLMAGLHVYDQFYSAALRQRVMTKFTGLPLGWFQGRRHAEVRKLAQDDITALHYLVTHAIVDLVTAVVTPLVILGYLFSVNWTLALVLLIPIVAYVVIMVRLGLSDRPRLNQMLRWNATLPGEAENYIGNQPVSRVFGDRATVDFPGELAKLNAFLKEWQRITIDTKATMIQLNRPLTSLVLIATAGTALVGIGWMPATAILPFLVLGTSFGDRLLAVSYAANGLREGMLAKSALELLLTTPELAAGTEPAPRGAEAASLRFDGVTFGYTPGRNVVENFDLTPIPGGTTAIVGPSGSGKSTVAALAARLWDPAEGSVTLDGVDLKTIGEDELRGQIAVVLQDVQLIAGTVADNIALGHPQATREQIAAAARTAFIAAEIEALPDGYDTVVDRDSLSGGQRQRIAIARALLGDPRLVVLDEATAAADPDSEWEVRQGLSKLLEGRTVLVIAHRLHTVAEADLIVVLDDGKIAEQGTRTELLANDGLYARMQNQAMEALA